MKLSIASPAKINPNLAVLSRRADGLHEVSMTMLALDFCDEIDVSLVNGATDVQIELHGPALTPDIPADERNLACRGAAIALDIARENGLDREVGIRLEIEKNIPSQAGLGGGSSNAAAAALGAANLLGIDPSEPGLLERVCALGADVAFFARARATGFARCRGIGDQVTPLDLARTPRAFALLTPQTSCSTASVYAALESSDFAGSATDDRPDRWFDTPLERARESLANGLEAAALRSHPELAEFRKRLTEVGGQHFRLAGSGSSFFGLFPDARSAHRFLESESVTALIDEVGVRVATVARRFADSDAPQRNSYALNPKDSRNL